MSRKQEIIEQIKTFAKQKLKGETSGHDWFHIERVRKIATDLSEKEGADLFICEAAVLLHDVIDDKLVKDEEAALLEVKRLLSELNVEDVESAHIVEIITTMSFKGGGNQEMRTIEGKVVQDADRLDALGAIGIARTFMYAGSKGQPMHEPDLSPRMHTMSKEEYRSGKSTAINHFYEKLFQLKDRINTEAGLKIAEERHRYMETFINAFLEEWKK
ncbi:HD domain-containing protein [Alkalihalobacillus sp. AL-G]|uniref:HD domain-containing protein n=1 Tax=Alkalihalobacillus sp. AL-G TaxID=2926399 RepID=UPI00272C7FA8|nr:HD domain-containing protein [Alkalihalobacillus sp. AL-G]WLD91522.1 HD domain-containing protein [Alkalihalobacillus sp. AL-G]